MGLRFRKRIKILPGINLNLGLGGVSVSTGVPGLRFNLSKRGLSRTVGIPGTGFYHTERIRSAPRRQNSFSRGQSVAIQSLEELKAAAATPGAVFRHRDSGRKASSASVLAEIRRMETQRAISSARDQIQAEQDHLEELLNFWKDIPRIPSWDEYTAALAPEVFVTDLARPLEPDEVQARREHLFGLEQELATQFPYRFLPKFTYRSKIKALEHQRWPGYWECLLEAFRQKFEVYQAEYSRQAEDWQTAEAERTQFLYRMMSGDLEAVVSGAEATIEAINFPFETECEIFAGEAVALFLHLDLPEIEDVIPSHRKEVLKKGSIRERKIPPKERNEMYARLVLGHAVFVSSTILSAVPYPQHINVTAYTQRARRKAGDPVDTYVLGLGMSREALAAFDAEVEDILDWVRGQHPVMDLDADFHFCPIERPAWLAEVES
ncbi:MAG: DUF4236 domain-containing protein [Candidatus Methylacidiphilales bacterium]|nr:DUF4236 domain-containing protein [Candidatus Methylacidiphilales bacterium]